MLNRAMALAYGIFCYLAFFAVFLYAIGFIGNLFVLRSIDSGPISTPGDAMAIDAVLLGVFAVQHSVMARPWFKRLWTRVVPAPVERSTYVLLSSLCLGLLFWQWRPITGTIWQIDSAVGQAVALGFYATGWLIVLISTFLTSHFDLFGLRQTWARYRDAAYVPLPFQKRGFYKLVRHPLYVGWLLTFWSAPTMTVAHLAFATATTIYILIAIGFEEKDLVSLHGESYLRYREEVPMLAPSFRLARIRGARKRAE